MSNNDFSMMGRPRPEAPLPQRSNAGLYALFGGGVIAAALVGALVTFLVLRETGPGPVARNGARPAGQQQARQQARGGVAGPQWATTGTYGAGWLVRCQLKDGKPGKPCVALLQVVNQQTKRTLLAWIVGTDDKGGYQTVLQTASGINVGKGIDVKFGTEMPRHADFSNCLPAQCIASTAMDAAFVKDMTSQKEAHVIVVASTGRALDFTIPLAGADKALADLKK